MDLQSLDGYVYFPDTYAQRCREQEECHPKYPGGDGLPGDVNEEHGDHAQQKAEYPQDLHRAREIKPAAQVGDLGEVFRVMRPLMLLLQGTHDTGVREETVRIGQKDKRDSRE